MLLWRARGGTLACDTVTGAREWRGFLASIMMCCLSAVLCSAYVSGIVGWRGSERRPSRLSASYFNYRGANIRHRRATAPAPHSLLRVAHMVLISARHTYLTYPSHANMSHETKRTSQNPISSGQATGHTRHGAGSPQRTAHPAELFSTAITASPGQPARRAGPRSEGTPLPRPLASHGRAWRLDARDAPSLQRRAERS